MNIREPYFAGSFYPANSKILKEKILSFLQSVSSETTYIQPKILMVPHAGYDYSGCVAAYAYKKLCDLPVKRVILIGCSHQVYFEGAAIWGRGKWQTPLGEIAINEKLAQKIVDSQHIVENISPHLNEHSLEVQLPFLQVTLRNSFTLLPIMLGEIDKLSLERFCNTIQKNLDSETVIIISSDLSHYPTYEVANKVDKMIVQAILSKDTQQLKTVINRNMQQRYKGLVTCACGQQAIVLGMTIAKNLKLEGELLKYANSGDVIKDHNQVVGYAAIAWR